MTLDFTAIDALIIDMDGVLWLGDSPLPGLNDLFDFLLGEDFPFMLATNNASKTPDQYQQKFAKFGIEMPREHIMTSSLATAAYCQQELPPESSVFVVGTDGIREAMKEVGFKLLADSSAPAAAVVVGLDFNLTYEKLKHAVLLIQRGARFIGTNGDLTYPIPDGFAPGAGSILAAIEAATQVTPVTVGKPEPLMFEIAVDKLGSELARTAMIGDRLETDILGGQQAGLKTILVSTGVDTTDSIAEKGIEPDIVLGGIDNLLARLKTKTR